MNDQNEVLRLKIGNNIKSTIMDITRFPHCMLSGNEEDRNAFIDSLALSFRQKINDKMVNFIYIESDDETTIKNMVDELHKRQELIRSSKCNTIKDYNAKSSNPLPYMIVVIEDCDKLLRNCGEETKENLSKLLQLSRPVGIHFFLSTSDSSEDAIPFELQMNINTRFIFKSEKGDAFLKEMKLSKEEKKLSGNDVLIYGGDSIEYFEDYTITE